MVVNNHVNMTNKEVHFITDAKGKKTHAILPIDTYNQLVALKGLLKHTAPIGEHEFYTFSIKNASAKGYPDGTRSKPYFVVVKGSQAVLEPVQSIPPHIAKQREDLLSDGTLELDPVNNCFVFIKDLKFSSASTAAAIIAGNVRNGLDVWTNREGFSLKESGYGLKKSKNAPRK
jgi:hypothetical protein